MPKVYLACASDEIVGSTACAIRDGLINGKTRKVGYEFQ